jgi:hypothetical protein
MQLVNKQNKISLRYLFSIFVIALSIVGCSEENNKPDSGFSRSDYLGKWICTEVSGPNAPQLYEIEITAGTASDDMNIIGLANQGSSFVLKAKALSQGFNIPLQTVDGLTITGTAVTGNELSPIDVLFDLDDGSGVTTTEAVLSL